MVEWGDWVVARWHLTATSPGQLQWEAGGEVKLGALKELDDPGALQPEVRSLSTLASGQEGLSTEPDPPRTIVAPQKFRYTPIAQPMA